MRLFFLSTPHIKLAGKPIELNSRKGLALLAYLAVTGESHSRDALGTMLWPEHDQRQARSYLRHALWTLRKALGNAWLETSREHVSLNPEADIWLDVTEFQQQLSALAHHDHRAEEVCAQCQAPLTEAAALYHADFLAGFTLLDCPDFDEWQFFQAEGLRQALAGTLERLIRLHEIQGEYEVAIPYARRWLLLDLLHEPAHRQLMQLYARAGQQAAALRQYQECVRILRDELEAPPEEATTTLYEAIKVKQLPHPPVKEHPYEHRQKRKAMGEQGRDVHPSSAPPPPRSAAPHSTCPSRPLPLSVGRRNWPRSIVFSHRSRPAAC